MEKRAFLLPGDMVTTAHPMQLATLLGSCVSVCLYNLQRDLAAMNHFMLPLAEGNPDVGRFGDTSTEKIIVTLLARDGNPDHYQAKVFGGGHVVGAIGGTMRIGERNIAAARSILGRYRIRVVDEDVGGKHGRRVAFDTGARETVCAPIPSSAMGSACARPGKTRVLIVDDSETVRRLLRHALTDVEGFEVAGEARDAFEAREKILSLEPDMLTLDIEMPKLDGLSFLQRLTQYLPTRVVVISSKARSDSPIPARARQLGAADVIDKADLELFKGVDRLRASLLPRLTAAARTAAPVRSFSGG
ncbi:MAG: response regulator [Myxococcales bacterium]|nr:response regulator [Myxococcales bacterium]